MFYEVMWRAWARGGPYPLPWWLQQTFRRWIDNFDDGLFDSKEAALSSNALYRYWSMVGVKDAHQESLVGQAGEVEPVYERYAVSFFLVEGNRLHMPHWLEPGGVAPALRQERQEGYLPVMTTTYRPPMGVEVEERTLATTVGVRQRAIVLNRLTARPFGAGARAGMLCVAVTPVKPSGFVRHDRAGRYLADSQLSFLRYLPSERRLETNTASGPVFDSAPATFGLYGNAGSWDPEVYLTGNAFTTLAGGGTLERGRDGERQHRRDVHGRVRLAVRPLRRWGLPARLPPGRGRLPRCRRLRGVGGARGRRSRGREPRLLARQAGRVRGADRPCRRWSSTSSTSTAPAGPTC